MFDSWRKFFTRSIDIHMKPDYFSDSFELNVTIGRMLIDTESGLHHTCVQIQKEIGKFLGEKHFYYSRNRIDKKEFEVAVSVNYPDNFKDGLRRTFGEMLSEELEHFYFMISMSGSQEGAWSDTHSRKSEIPESVYFHRLRSCTKSMTMGCDIEIFPKEDYLIGDDPSEPLFDLSEVLRVERVSFGVLECRPCAASIIAPDKEVMGYVMDFSEALRAVRDSRQFVIFEGVPCSV